MTKILNVEESSGTEGVGDEETLSDAFGVAVKGD